MSNVKVVPDKDFTLKILVNIFNVLIWINRKKLNKFVPLFFPVHSRKGDIGEWGVEKKEEKITALGEIGSSLI